MMGDSYYTHAMDDCIYGRFIHKKHKRLKERTNVFSKVVWAMQKDLLVF